MLMKTTTGYIKSPYNIGDCKLLEDYLSIYDPDKDQYIPYGYIVHDNALYIPNIEIERFMKPLGETTIVDVPSNPWKPMSQHYMSRYAPRNAMQENIIAFITGDGQFKSNANEHQIGIVAKPGAGKAQPYDEMTPTPNGYVPFGDLKVGDYVLSEHGKPIKVLSIHEQGLRMVYRLTFDDGRIAHCCDEHLWDVISLNNDEYVPQIIPFHKIRNDYRYSIDKEKDAYLYKYFFPMIDVNHNTSLFKEATVSFDPLLAGIFIAKAHSHTRFVKMSGITDEVADAVTKYYKHLAYKWDPNSNTYQFVNKITKLPVRLKSIVPPRIYELIYRHHPNDRVIPLEYLFNTVDVLDKFLVGYVIATRYPTQVQTENGLIVMYSEAPLILQQLVDHIRSRGLKPVILKISDKLSAVHLFWDDDDSFIDDALILTDVTPVGKKKCRCITVDNPTGLYLTSGYVVTHNTFTSVYSLSILNRRALVVTHMTKITKQWINTFLNMFDYQGDNILELTSSHLDKALEGHDFGKDVYFISHQTIGRWITNQSPIALNKALITLGIGVKVIDEYHLHWRNSLILDMFTNVDKTIYLTATFDRSSSSESSLFRKITAKIPTYGNGKREEEEKHTVYLPITYSTKCPYKVVKRMGSGFGMGMRKSIYADWAHFDDPSDTTNRIILDLILKCLESEGKILITTASIKSCEFLATKIQSLYPDLMVGSINSTNTAKENEYRKSNASIIVSTIQSAGTGVDIPGLRYVINAEPFSSKVTAEQFLGRLRPYFDSNGEQRNTFMFDLVDKSIIFCNAYFKGRSKRIAELVKEITPLEM